MGFGSRNGATFTKRHMIAVAEIIRELTDVAARDLMIDRFAHMFAADNDAFDRERFEHACKTGEVFTARRSFDKHAHVDPVVKLAAEASAEARANKRRAKRQPSLKEAP